MFRCPRVLRADSGNIAFTRATDESITGGPAVANGMLYFSAGNMEWAMCPGASISSFTCTAE